MYPMPQMYKDWTRWAAALIQKLSQPAPGPQVQQVTVATLPRASIGQIVYVSDETGGGVLAFSDGTDWRRVTDRAVVS